MLTTKTLHTKCDDIYPRQEPGLRELCKHPCSVAQQCVLIATQDELVVQPEDVSTVDLSNDWEAQPIEV